MFFPHLRASLKFFWTYLTPLLGRLLPVLLPLLLLANYRFFTVLGADAEKLMQDPISLLLQMLAGLAGSALAMVYTVAVLQGESTGVVALWRRALPRLGSLFFVQILVGAAVVLGLFALILPGLYLMGVLLPAYVLVVIEGQAPIAAVRSAWQRFRARPWELAASFCFVLSALLLVLGGLESLQKLVEAQALVEAAQLPVRLATATGLDLIGALFTQLVAILLVHVWFTAQTADKNDETKAGQSGA